MTDTATPALDTAERIFKSLIWDNAVSGALVALFTYCPYLAVPPLKQIISGVGRMATDGLFKFLKLFVDVSAIKLKNAVAQHEYDNASVRLMIVAIEKGVDSEEFRKANEADKAALAKFVHFGAA